MDKKYITLNEACQNTSIKYHQLYQLITKKKIKSRYTDGEITICLDDCMDEIDKAIHRQYGKRNTFTTDDLEFLYSNFSKLGPKYCSEKMNRNYGVVIRKAKELGLKYEPHGKIPKNKKACPKCNELLTLDKFGKDKNRKDSLTPWCKKCQRIQRNTPESKKRKQKYDSKYVKEKLKSDPKYRLNRYMRKRANAAIKAAKLNIQLHRTNKLIGCTIGKLKEHLESQFKDGMSWDNYGSKGWHVDHIKPILSFNLNDENERKKAFHYSNLQPLWWWENLSKGSKL